MRRITHLREQEGEDQQEGMQITTHGGKFSWFNGWATRSSIAEVQG
jgi:hypothetical protein